jgi:predicted PhzF superfamily epimerase YddE/YHI9
VHPAAMWRGMLSDQDIAASGVPSNLVRLAAGTEDTEDLVTDVLAAADTLARVREPTEGPPVCHELRTFAPGVGVSADPDGGSMNAAVAQWFLRTGTVSGSYRVSQGRRLDRAGDITITADPDGTIGSAGTRTPCSTARPMRSRAGPWVSA